MATRYFIEALQRYRDSRAAFVGCASEDFERDELVVVEKALHPGAKHLLIALTFGTGTVVSVSADYLEWTMTNAPRDKHYSAMTPDGLFKPLAEEGARRGESVTWGSPNLGFIPAETPTPVALPVGYSGIEFEWAWREKVFETGEFHNALGELDDPSHENFRYGFAVLREGRPLAVAGAWDDFGGSMDIGVDVARDARGLGLAPIAVRNLAAIIHARGDIPSYSCAPTNIRSHRNAIASGFTPVASAARAFIRRPAE